jgi:predicted nucleic acid-binding protein
LVGYVDSSVVLARLLGEARQPSGGFWGENLVSSRLLEYEVWVRLHVYGRAAAAAEVGALLTRLALAESRPHVVRRALVPFPRAVRTLDALHLATMDHLRSTESDRVLATYDQRMAEVA